MQRRYKPFYIAEMPSPVIQATGKASLSGSARLCILPSQAFSECALASGYAILIVREYLCPSSAAAPRAAGDSAGSVRKSDGQTLPCRSGQALWQTQGIIYAAAGATSSSTEIPEHCEFIPLICELLSNMERAKQTEIREVGETRPRFMRLSVMMTNTIKRLQLR